MTLKYKLFGIPGTYEEFAKLAKEKGVAELEVFFEEKAGDCSEGMIPTDYFIAIKSREGELEFRKKTAHQTIYLSTGLTEWLGRAYTQFIGEKVKELFEKEGFLVELGTNFFYLPHHQEIRRGVYKELQCDKMQKVDPSEIKLEHVVEFN